MWTPHHNGEDDAESSAKEDSCSGYCLCALPNPQERNGTGVDVQSVSEDLMRATVQALPYVPEKVTNLRGPALEVTRVDSHTADIKIIHGFRAHFRGSMKKKHAEEGAFENCLIQSPGEQLKKRILHRGSLSFSDLSELENGPCDVLDVSQRCQWEIDPAEIKLGRRIAVGGFAEVFVGEYEGTIVAVKRMFDHDSAAIEQFKKEVSILAKLRHPNLILFMGYCRTPELSIVSEFMQKGSLYDTLRSHDGVPLAPGYLELVAVSVARGMSYLHSRDPPILHLDLKSPNILIDSAWRVKITDFGLSRLRNRTLVSGNQGGNGTPHWMSPEMIRGEQIDEKSDVFSFGIILWELLTGQVPWEKLNPIQVIAAVGFKNRRLPRPQHPDTLLISLMDRCSAPQPDDRPTFAEILQTLDEHYCQSHSCKLPALSLRKEERSDSVEPPSPAVGTVVEIFGSDATSPSAKTQTVSDPSVEDPSKEEPHLEKTMQPVASRRSVELLEEFELKLRSRQSHQTTSTTAMSSPFGQLASTPFDESDADENPEGEVCETRSCNAAFGSNPQHGAPGSFSFSPFAAYSAMPFVDSAQLQHNVTSTEGSCADHEGTTSTATITDFRSSNVPTVSQKSFKSQVSAVYDDPPFTDASGRESGCVSYDHQDATAFFHFDAKEDDSEWKIKVADVKELDNGALRIHGTNDPSSPTQMHNTPHKASTVVSSRPSESSHSHEAFDLDLDQEGNDTSGVLGVPPLSFHTTSHIHFRNSSPRDEQNADQSPNL